MEKLQRPMSRLLFAVAELFSQGRIDGNHKSILKELIFKEDKPLMQAAASYENAEELKI